MNLQLYEKFNESTTEKFNEWLALVKEPERILTRLPFTVKFSECKFLELKEKQTKDEKGNDITIGAQKAKMLSESGKEIGYKFQSPSVLAQRGFTRGKSKTGQEVESIAVIYDVRNPEHKHFMDEFDRAVVEPCMRMIVKEPGTYKIDGFVPITDTDPTQNPEYGIAKRLVMMKMAKIFRFPMKDAKNFDLASPYRYFYYNPMDYQDREDPTKPPSKMKVWLALDPAVPAREISPEELMAMCEGWDIVDGKVIKKDAKGFECSPEGYVQKLHVGATLSIKVLCSSVVVTRFFTSPKMNSQADKLAYVAQHGTVDKTFTSLDELLAGLKGTVIKTPVNLDNSGGSFDPMGGNESSQLPAVNTQGSLLIAASAAALPPVQATAVVVPSPQMASLSTPPVGSIPQAPAHAQSVSTILPSFVQQPSGTHLPPPATQTNFAQFMSQPPAGFPQPPVAQLVGTNLPNPGQFNERIAMFQSQAVPVVTDSNSI